jgi:predicted DNA-binding transcriptional regulator YafY
MSRPTQRLLAVLEMLQSERSWSGAGMARRLGVNERTVRRLVARLEAMGVPVTADRGRGGGYALRSGFRLPPMMFTDDEAIALAIGLRAARALGLAGAAPAVTAAQAKLERVLPPGPRSRVRALDESLAIDLGVRRPSGDDAVFATLGVAAHGRRRVRIGYRDGSGRTSERTVEPYAIAFRGGCWYAVGWCRERRDLRSFRVDRIERIETLPERFEPPAGFDALGYLSESIASIPRAHAVEVVLDTDLATARREVFPAFGVLEPVAGGVRLRGHADDLAWFARELSRLPFGFAIRRPAALRTALAAQSTRLARLARRAPGGRRRG